MKYSNDEQLQGLNKGRGNLPTTRKVSSSKLRGDVASCKGTGSMAIHRDSSDKSVRSQSFCMRSVSRGNALSNTAKMTGVFNREGDETMRAMDTITNMRCNQAKIAEKYRDL